MVNIEDIMEEIRKLAKELAETTDEKQIILLINKIDSLKYKIIDTYRKKPTEAEIIKQNHDILCSVLCI